MDKARRTITCDNCGNFIDPNATPCCTEDDTFDKVLELVNHLLDDKALHKTDYASLDWNYVSIPGYRRTFDVSITLRKN